MKLSLVTPTLLAINLLTTGGCVRRQFSITSEPSGAMLYLNDREIGRTPLTTDFTWYGTYDVVLRKEGYELYHKKTKVYSPWWGWPPFDFFAELMPFHPTDLRSFNYVMQPAVPVSTTQIMERAVEMRKQLPTTLPDLPAPPPP